MQAHWRFCSHAAWALPAHILILKQQKQTQVALATTVAALTASVPTAKAATVLAATIAALKVQTAASQVQTAVLNRNNYKMV